VIRKDEIEAKAAKFGLHTTDVEGDYVFGWLQIDGIQCHSR